MRLIFKISEGRLECYPDKGFSYVMSAQSGIGECMNRSSIQCISKSYTGPLSIGIYHINPRDLNDPIFLFDVGRRVVHGDWGDWRIKLTPYLINNMYGRNNFFIHGGDFPGSAGCIDIGGGIWGNKHTDLLKNDILSTKFSITLYVEK